MEDLNNFKKVPIQDIFLLDFDLHIKHLTWTLTLDSILWTTLNVCGYSFTGKVYFILNSWFLTKLYQMQLVSGPCKTFSCILTVDLDR